ncbi:MAG: YetF domain-containing protein [Oceanicaulis sp.]
MFFDGWQDIWRVLIVGATAYVALVAILRVTGKRTLSKMNAFDLVVTVALGSTLASVILSKDVSVSEGVAAFLLLCGLQFVATFAATRSERFQSLIKADPALIFHQGRFLRGAMKRERVTDEEVRAAARDSGYGDLKDVAAVVLETDGSFTVLGQGEDPAPEGGDLTTEPAQRG